MTGCHEITVSTHVGRDLLQSANIFKTADVAVWEYIVNSLQYVEAGVAPSVEVQIDNSKKRITIRDNGQGKDGGGGIDWCRWQAAGQSGEMFVII